MNAHEILDEALFRMVGILDGRGFAGGTRAPGLLDLTLACRVPIPGDLDRGGMREVPVHTPSGKVTPGILAVADPSSTQTHIVYHHGLSEIPFDDGFSSILLPPPAGVGLFAIRAAHHGSRAEFPRAVESLEALVVTMAASAVLIEGIRRALGGSRLVVAGTSLGGFVANLHAIAFGTADAYVPMLAGLAFDHTISETVFSRNFVRLDPAAKERITRSLNLEANRDRLDPARTFPLQARFDRIVDADRQIQSYGPHIPVETVARGHVSGARSHSLLRDHIMTAMGG